MAIDTEPKRWSMLRWSSGVAPTLVFNPTGADADTVIERVTVLGLYGGIAFAAVIITTDAIMAVVAAYDIRLALRHGDEIASLTNWNSKVGLE